jgi:CBS domain-containing protein
MMTAQLQEVMTPNPVCLGTADTVADAAIRMRDHHIGDVLVTEDGRLRGLVTDRDLVIRVVAAGRDPATTRLGEVLSGDPVCAHPSDNVDYAVALMREYALRRLPVCEGERVVGIVTIGDLAVDQDPNSALADISAAPADL